MADEITKQPPHKLRLLIISVVIGILSGFLLIGLPGALVLELIALAYAQLGMSPLDLHGDAVWPTAIMISLLWPVPITPLAVIHFRQFPQASLLNRWLFSLVGSLLLTALVTFLLLM